MFQLRPGSEYIMITLPAQILEGEVVFHPICFQLVAAGEHDTHPGAALYWGAGNLQMQGAEPEAGADGAAVKVGVVA